MKHTLKLLSSFLKVNIQMSLAYRADTVVNILLNLMWLGWELLSLNIIFSNTTTLGGWGLGELIALLGVFRLVNTLMIALIWPNTEKFNQSIRDGSMDYTLLQPVNSMFLVTFSRITVWRIWDLGAGYHPDRGRHQHGRRHHHSAQHPDLYPADRFGSDRHLQPVDRADRADLLVHQIRQQRHHPAGPAGFRALPGHRLSGLAADHRHLLSFPLPWPPPFPCRRCAASWTPADPALPRGERGQLLGRLPVLEVGHQTLQQRQQLDSALGLPAENSSSTVRFTIERTGFYSLAITFYGKCLGWLDEWIDDQDQACISIFPAL